MTRHVVPDEVSTREEPFADAVALDRVPGTPFAFIWFLVRTHFPGRMVAMIAIALAAASIDAAGPLGFSHLVNGVIAAKTAHQDFGAVLPWIALLGAIWFAGGFAYRGYEAIDVETSPRMRGLAQKYLFAYMLGHSPRYFQDNFAGKLGQKIKQAGQATIGILQIVCFDMVRVTGSVLLGGALMASQHPSYAVILGAWTVLYLGIVLALAKRCVVLSKALSDEISTSTGRMIDAISNADLIRAFAKAVYERKFLSFFLADEMNASRRLRWFLITMRSFMHLATLCLMVALVFVAARDWFYGALTAGAFTMIFLLGNQVGRGVQDLSFRMLDYFEQLGTLAEALELVSKPHEIRDSAGAVPLDVRQGAIRFEHVRFGHADGHMVFEDLNLDIRPGEKVGLVGP